MKYINIKKVEAGAKLGKDLVDDQGRMLLRKDTILTDKILSILLSKGLEHLYINDELTKDIEIEEIIPQYLKNNTIQSLKKLDIDKTIDNAKNIVDNILSYRDISVEVYSDSDKDSSLFEHSMAVTQFAVLFGNSLGFNQAELNDLAISSLLHDIGKICETNPENLKKYNFEEVFNDFGIEYPKNYEDKYHPLYGYTILKGVITLNSVIKSSILRHHENFDGTGLRYASSSSGNRTSDKFANIINICDSFVRLMTNTYSDAKMNNVIDVIEYMHAYSDKKFDPDLVEKFFQNVPIFPKGLVVDLSNGMQAIIVDSNKNMPTRPKIMIYGTNKIVDLMDPRLQSLLITGFYGNDNFSLNRQI